MRREASVFPLSPDSRRSTRILFHRRETQKELAKPLSLAVERKPVALLGPIYAEKEFLKHLRFVRVLLVHLLSINICGKVVGKALPEMPQRRGGRPVALEKNQPFNNACRLLGESRSRRENGIEKLTSVVGFELDGETA